MTTRADPLIVSLSGNNSHEHVHIITSLLCEHTKTARNKEGTSDERLFVVYLVREEESVNVGLFSHAKVIQNVSAYSISATCRTFMRLYNFYTFIYPRLNTISKRF